MRDLTPAIPHEVMKYGAPMGRRSWNDVQDKMYKGRMYLRHIRLDSGGYDSGGAYWGIGDRLYGYNSADPVICGPCNGTGKVKRIINQVYIDDVRCKHCVDGMVDDAINGFIRASDRTDAMRKVRTLHPDCVFFGRNLYFCESCGRPENDCSTNPCPAVIADRVEKLDGRQ